MAAALPLTAAASVSAVPLADTNLLQNPSFESGFTNGVANAWSK